MLDRVASLVMEITKARNIGQVVGVVQEVLEMSFFRSPSFCGAPNYYQKRYEEGHFQKQEFEVELSNSIKEMDS